MSLFLVIEAIIQFFKHLRKENKHSQVRLPTSVARNISWIFQTSGNVCQLHAVRPLEAIDGLNIFSAAFLPFPCFVCKTIKPRPGQKFSIILPYHLHGIIELY